MSNIVTTILVASVTFNDPFVIFLFSRIPPLLPPLPHLESLGNDLLNVDKVFLELLARWFLC